MPTLEETRKLAEETSEETLKRQLCFSRRKVESPLEWREDYAFHRQVIRIVEAELKKRRRSSAARSTEEVLS